MLRRAAGLTWALAAFALAGGPASSAGQQRTRPDQIGCSIEGASLMVFGDYDTFSDRPLDQQGRVGYRCYDITRGRAIVPTLGDSNRKVDVTISISAGNSGNFSRYMRGPDQLFYNLYLDRTGRNVWGDGTAGTSVHTDRVRTNNETHDVPVFGTIFGGQDVTFGLYADSLVVTLDF
jgi:spore coat protein U-like protein